MVNQGGITSAKGFLAWGDHVGLKKRRKDLALIASETPAICAAAFTTNVAAAAPIKWNRQVVAAGAPIKAILINAGQANACTGAQGFANATLMAEKAATSLGCEPSQILLASTGIIGIHIPMEKALAGIPAVAAQLRNDEVAACAAAEAILTTDSGVKQCATSFMVNDVEVTLGAMAKGSGMIHPNMATMLAFITTDANIAPHLLTKALKASVARTYNMISVDGDTSTNDMVAILANGEAGNALIDDEQSIEFKNFCQALDAINVHLAKKIATDAEGVTKRIAVTITGAATESDAMTLAKSVVSSNLVKSALFEADPNWGRVMVALGYAGVQFDPDKVDISFSSTRGKVAVVANGEQHPDFSTDTAKYILATNEVQIEIDMRAGESCSTAWGCDSQFDSIRKTATLDKTGSLNATGATRSAAQNNQAQDAVNALHQLIYAEVG